MRARDAVFVLLGGVFAVVCLWLGAWQLRRLAERRAFNEELRSRAATAPVDVRDLPADTAQAHFRRVRISGTYDFDREIVVTNRSRDGSPGVNIITPVRIADSDSAVLVNRGWVYSPDAMTVDLTRWREPEHVESEGYTETYPTRSGDPRSSSHTRAYRWLEYRTISQAFPYPIGSYYVVLISKDEKTPVGVPPRVAVPPLDEGSHRSYAIQWFSFAAISIFGMVLYLRRK
jgi:surfeit locus 1 family protein